MDMLETVKTYKKIQKGRDLLCKYLIVNEMKVVIDSCLDDIDNNRHSKIFDELELWEFYGVYDFDDDIEDFDFIREYLKDFVEHNKCTSDCIIEIIDTYHNIEMDKFLTKDGILLFKEYLTKQLDLLTYEYTKVYLGIQDFNKKSLRVVK